MCWKQALESLLLDGRMLMIRKCTVFFLLAFNLLAQDAGDLRWNTLQESPHLSRCRAEVTGKNGGQSFKAILEIVHAAGENETYSFNVILPNASAFKLLNLTDLEADPGGPISDKKTLNIRPKAVAVKDGYSFFAEGRVGYSGTDTFTFDKSTKSSRGTKDPVYALLNSAMVSSEDWVVSIANPLNAKQSVSISFDFKGARTFLKAHLH